MAVDRDQLPEGIGRDVGATGQLCRELVLAGFTPLLTPDSDGILAGGVTLPAPPVATEQFRRQVLAVLIRGLPLSVSLGPAAGHEGVVEALQRAAADAAVPASRIEIVIRAEPAIVHEYLDTGFVVHCQCRNLDHEAWQHLWELRTNSLFHIDYAADVLPVIPLLSVERATGVLPAIGIQVPAGTAWLPARFDLSRFANDRGVVEENLLEDALRRGVEILDRMFGHLRWPTPQMRHDAWLNRRLAIDVTGTGDLVMKRGLDPRCFGTLEELDRLLRRVRSVLRSQTRLIAERMQGLPALEKFDPSESLPGGRVRSSWRAKWLDAVELESPRHRNLIAMSPWSLFPGSRPADIRCADLLPLLRLADACGSGGAPDLSRWDVNEFKAFHRRAMAVLQQRDVGHSSAETP